MLAQPCSPAAQNTEGILQPVGCKLRAVRVPDDLLLTPRSFVIAHQMGVSTLQALHITSDCISCVVEPVSAPS